MYWIWTNRRAHDEQARISTAPEVILKHDLQFDRGQLVAQKFPTIVIVQDDDSQGTLTDNLIAPGINGLAFSSRLREILAAVGVDNLQYFPAILANSVTGAQTEDYLVANIVGRVSCLDVANSALVMDPDEPTRIQFINSLALDEAKIGGVDLFRLHEKTQVIVASQRVKDAMESSAVTGVRFYAPAAFKL